MAGEGAVVDHYKVQQESAEAYHVATMQVQLGAERQFSSHSISLGGALVRNDANAVLSEGRRHAERPVHRERTQHIDNHTAIDHAKPHANSHELYKGILDGSRRAVFNGRIIVRKDAQKTDSKQTNKNLVLSDDAVINTKPELQILRRRRALHARRDHRPDGCGIDVLPAVARHRPRPRRAAC